MGKRRKIQRNTKEEQSATALVALTRVSVWKFGMHCCVIMNSSPVASSRRREEKRKAEECEEKDEEEGEKDDSYLRFSELHNTHVITPRPCLKSEETQTEHASPKSIITTIIITSNERDPSISHLFYFAFQLNSSHRCTFI